MNDKIISLLQVLISIWIRSRCNRNALLTNRITAFYRKTRITSSFVNVVVFKNADDLKNKIGLKLNTYGFSFGLTIQKYMSFGIIAINESIARSPYLDFVLYHELGHIYNNHTFSTIFIKWLTDQFPAIKQFYNEFKSVFIVLISTVAVIESFVIRNNRPIINVIKDLRFPDDEYTRRNELEADEFSVRITKNSSKAVEFLRKFKDQIISHYSNLTGTKWIALTIEERIEKLKKIPIKIR